MIKQYIITDPCYILPKNIWAECLNKTHTASSPFDNNLFCSSVEKLLSEYTGNKAFVNVTGYGDWINHLWDNNSECIGQFCSDSGLVCVCECTEEVANKMKTIPNCGVVFDTKSEVTVGFDTKNPNWTVINIFTNDDCWTTDVE